jgi:hypothetical protein
MASLVLSPNHLSGTDIQQVDPDTCVKLQAFLEATGKSSCIILFHLVTLFLRMPFVAANLCFIQFFTSVDGGRLFYIL